MSERWVWACGHADAGKFFKGTCKARSSIPKTKNKARLDLINHKMSKKHSTKLDYRGIVVENDGMLRKLAKYERF